jgi:hypothetical protein
MNISRRSLTTRSSVAGGLVAIALVTAVSPASAESTTTTTPPVRTTVAQPVRTTTSAPVRTSLGDRTEAGIAAAKLRCEAAVKERLVAIDRLTARVRIARELTPAHAAGINAYLSAAKSGLAALAGTIAADTDLVALTRHCTSVAEDYRIFALRVPQTHVIIVADAETGAAARLTKVADSLATAIDKAKAAGKNTAAAETALAQLRTHLTNATTQLSGVADKVMAFEPSDWNADHSILEAPSTAVRSARVELRAAAVAARSGLKALR